MKIADITITPFRAQVHRYQNGEALPAVIWCRPSPGSSPTRAPKATIWVGVAMAIRMVSRRREQDYRHRLRPMLIGQDPFDREKFWQWLWAAKTPENLLSALDMALWDLLGRVTNLPVYKLLGGCRDKVLAYASTYPNMGSPENYADHAAACQQQGYRAYKIHPYYYWDPATGKAMPGRPSHIAWDIEVCRAVRARVGDSMVLMFDPWGTYHIYEEALKVGRELEKLNFHWYEHPMPEHRVEPYVRLARALRSPSAHRDCRWHDLQPRGMDQARGLGHQPHRRAARRHHRRPEDGQHLRSLWSALRDPHERLRQSADPGRHQ